MVELPAGSTGSGASGNCDNNWYKGRRGIVVKTSGELDALSVSGQRASANGRNEPCGGTADTQADSEHCNQ